MGMIFTESISLMLSINDDFVGTDIVLPTGGGSTIDGSTCFLSGYGNSILMVALLVIWSEKLLALNCIIVVWRRYKSPVPLFFYFIAPTIAVSLAST